MTDVTTILSQIENGDPSAAEELLPLVYDELRRLAAARLANEKPGQTLQATALVHEVYVRLVDQTSPQPWDGRGHFFAAAAEAMRRILIDRARAKKRVKHGGDGQRRNLKIHCPASNETPDRLLAIDEALNKQAAAGAPAGRGATETSVLRRCSHERCVRATRYLASHRQTPVDIRAILPVR